MKKLKGRYVIVELIPTHSNPKLGEVIQIQALRLDNLKLIERFDYRLNKSLVNNPDLLQMTDYDNESFTYLDGGLLDAFKKWLGDDKLLIIDSEWTKEYLSDFPNKTSVFKYLNMKYSDDVIERMMAKYSLKPSSVIVDLIYEALLFELDI